MLRMRMDSGKLNIEFKWHTKTLTHLQWVDHSEETQTNGVQLFYPTSWLSCFFLCPFLRSKSNISQQHVRFVKTPFFSLVIYLIFCYKTCTGCLEQQQKYNIQLLCNFSCFNNHQFNRWILLGVSLPSDCSKSPNGLKSFWVLGRGVWVGGWGTNKYIGQDAKKLKQGFWLFLKPTQ